jgi:hypothetical protein
MFTGEKSDYTTLSLEGPSSSNKRVIKIEGNFYFESARWCLSRESGALGGNITNDQRIYDLYIQISVTRERERERGRTGVLLKMAGDGWRPFDGVLFSLSPLNLITLEYTKKYNPYIYDFVYTLVIKHYKML